MCTIGWDPWVCWADKGGGHRMGRKWGVLDEVCADQGCPGTWHLTEIPLLEPSRKGTTWYMQQNDARLLCPSPKGAPLWGTCPPLRGAPRKFRWQYPSLIPVYEMEGLLEKSCTEASQGKQSGRLHTLLPFSVLNSEHRVPLRDELCLHNKRHLYSAELASGICYLVV